MSRPIDDLFKALNMFNDGMKSLQMGRVLDNANSTVEQIRNSDLDAKQKRAELKNVADQLTFKLVGLGGSVDAAKTLAGTIEPQGQPLPQNEFQAYMLAQGDPEMMKALGTYQKDKAEAESLKRQAELDEWGKKFQIQEDVRDLNAAKKRSDKLSDLQDKFAQDAFKTLTTSQDYKQLQEVTQRAEAIRNFEQNPSAFGDIGAVFGFMKSIDPNSVVRESEYETARNAADLITQANNWISKKVTGEQLSDAQRRDLVRLSNDMKASFRENYERTAAPIRRQAQNRKVPLEFIDPMYEYKDETPATGQTPAQSAPIGTQQVPAPKAGTAPASQSGPTWFKPR